MRAGRGRARTSCVAARAVPRDSNPLTRIIRVRTRHTLRQSAIREFICQAIETVEYPGTTAEEFYDEIWRRVADNDVGVFLGLEGEVPKALAIALLPISATMMAPQVAIVYNAGPPSLIRAVGKRVKDWIVAGGYDRVMGMNLRHDAGAFARGFSYMGRPKMIGAVVEWRF